jgi:hypothetical protein
VVAPTTAAQVARLILHIPTRLHFSHLRSAHLSFSVTDGAATLLPTRTFTSLSAAETFFTDDPVSLGNITGAIDLTLNFKVIATAPKGVGISYVVAEAPVAGIKRANTHAPFESRAHPDERLMIGSDHLSELTVALAKFNLRYAATKPNAANVLPQLVDGSRPQEVIRRILNQGRR